MQLGNRAYCAVFFLGHDALSELEGLLHSGFRGSDHIVLYVNCGLDCMIYVLCYCGRDHMIYGLECAPNSRLLFNFSISKLALGSPALISKSSLWYYPKYDGTADNSYT